MGKSNPSAVGYARGTQVTTQTTARETFGGSKKAGLGRHIGMGEWTRGAIVNGSSGAGINAAPTVAGPYYGQIGNKVRRDDKGVPIEQYLRPATDPFGKVILGQDGKPLYYPISFVFSL